MILKDDWSAFLNVELSKDYYRKLQIFVEQEYKDKTIFPEYDNIFRAFNLVNPKELKVVIIGQDPYHGPKQANGLAFSVCDECKIPPSLKNIFKELADDMGCAYPSNGNLTQWAEQGVLLINAALTVIESKANSHKGEGWEIFTDSVISKISLERENIVFILWGAVAHKKEILIDHSKHFILKSAHPSPLSSYRGFFGSKPFSRTNAYLSRYDKKTIDWRLS